MTKLIVALGNPGSKYERTRHNAGFLVLDEIVSKIGATTTQSKFEGLYAKGSYLGEQVFFLKPQTFMNLSGRCVRGFRDYYNIDITDIIVIHDDIDMASGTVKTRKGGGAGGHNGIKSIAQELGSSDFQRIKIGVGKPDAKESGMQVHDWVLAKFSQEELDWLQGNAVEQTTMRLKQLFQQKK